MTGSPTVPLGRVGPYRLVDRLGEGGMGQVHLGRSPGGRTVAVKVVRPELAADPDFRERFAAEVEAASRVGGFSTAQLVDSDTTADHPWRATAYIPGPSLQEALRMHGALPLQSVAVLGAGLAEGLSAIHQCGLVHRDLKPANVILAHDGPRVIDFGIARALDGATTTHTRTVIGTPGFPPPSRPVRTPSATATSNSQRPYATAVPSSSTIIAGKASRSTPRSVLGGRTPAAVSRDASTP